ncbi:hypothetical protein VPH35_050710 [Triticum aestivum]
MHHAISLQFFDCWKILKAAERERWARVARAVPAKVLALAKFVPSEPADATPSEKVQSAHGELSRLMVLHDVAGRDLKLSALHLGVPHDDLWQRWCTRHAEVTRAGHQTLGSLRSAVNTIDLLDPTSGSATNKTGLGHETELLLRAQDEIQSARDGLRQMRSAATLEVFDAAWIALKRQPA